MPDSSIPQIVTTDTDVSSATADDGEGNKPSTSCPPSPMSRSLYLTTPQHRRSPSDPAFLSPPIATHQRRHSLDTSPSPTIYASSNDDHSPDVPPRTPSPQQSVHFAPSTPPSHKTTFLTAPSNYSSHRKGSFSSQTSSVGESTLASPHLTFSRDDKSSRTHVRTTSSASSKRISDDEADTGSMELRPRSPVPSSSRGSHEHIGITPGSRRSSGDADADADASNNSPEHTSIDMNEPDPAPFSFRPFQLASMLDPKNLEALKDIGGIDGLLNGILTDKDVGLGDDVIDDYGGGGKGDAGAGEGVSQQHDRQETDRSSVSLSERKRVYGDNVLPARATKSIWGLMWMALKDKVLILLSISAVVSLALGLFQDFGTPREPGEPPVDWVEGVAIIIAIAIVVLVGSLNDWQKERQFQKLNNQKEERGVKVIRGGQEHVIDVKEVVVGDIALLEPGEIVPCDGVFITGHNVRCDESGATGESDAIQKMSYEECVSLGDRAKHTDCFVVSGSKVLEGFGRYVVVAVGPKSFNGRIMMALRGDAENTPLQLKLNALAELIAKLGSLSGLLLFAALMIRFFIQLGKGQEYHTASEKGIAFVQIMIIAVTLIVVAVPEGLPLAVTLALAFATKRMTKEKLLVRVLGSCETMANASVVCTDKTGTLTENKMTVVAGSVGLHAKFVRDIKANVGRSHVGKEHPQQENKVEAPLGDHKPQSSTSSSSSASEAGHGDDFSLDQSELGQVMSPALCKLFNEAIAINSTAFEDKDPETGKLLFIGSKTETALLMMAQDLGWEDYRAVRSEAKVVQMIPFSSERKAMAVVVNIPGTNGRSDRWRMYVKGASEIVMRRTTKHVVVRRPGEGFAKAQESDEVEVSDIDEIAEKNITRTIIFYANQMLRTIAVCYKDFEQWPPQDTHPNDKGEIPYAELATDLTLIAITGLEDPLREGVREAVAKCHRAGVTVKMCTGDNTLTARSIAAQCGIFTGGLVMEGPAFRQLSDKEMEDIVPRLQVLARSSPDDKRILVSQLQKLGGIVGVTGDGTNDGPALKIADVGFSMGIAGTEVAKEASDIILMDDNFNSIVKAIMWGRCVNDAVRKFLQFQISTNVTACVITFVTAVASQSESSVLSAVQLLWINIIMDTFAALALATDPASESLLDRKPDVKTAPLFSVEMYKQIMIQSTYQIIMTLLFHFAGLQILGFENTKHNNDVIQTLVFNAFVFAQIFNSVNCRRLDSRLNVFEGMSRNWYFMGITLIELVVQVIIVFVGGAAFQVTHINGREWGISLAIGVVSLPLGALIRLLPNRPFEILLRALRILPREEALPKPRSKSDEWNSAIEIVRDNLGTFANVRGGRLRSSSFVIKSRSARLKRDQSALPSLMTMIPTMVATSMVAADWTSRRSSLADPAREDPSNSSMALHRGQVFPNPHTPDIPPHGLHPSPSRGSNQP